MAHKLEKSTFPANHTANDFQCFGPPATLDGEFDNCKIADMGCFTQDGKDSNKYYCAMVCQSRKTKTWFVYFEWGRTGAKSPQFQLAECRDEHEAQAVFAAQCHEKNDKRGVWATIAGVRSLTAKPGKDVYLVRQLATRSTGLPDARTIKSNEGAKKPVNVATSTSKHRQADNHTAQLLRDLIGGTVNYTRSSMADASIPTQNAIDLGRTILTEAQKRLVVVGSNPDDQIADNELRTLSGELYRRIPKKKAVGTPDSVWILSATNIMSWQMDLDAFESALAGETDVPDHDPFHGLPLHMEWIDPKTDLGKFLYYWWPRASGNRHANVSDMKIKNIWKVDRFGDLDILKGSQNKISQELKSAKIVERPLYQPAERYDLNPNEQEIARNTNTGLLFHGTRTVNVSSILRTMLRSPKELTGVSIAGANFGVATGYFADDWRKSAGYTSMQGSYWARGGGGIQSRAAFMFAADVICGQPYVAPAGNEGFKGPPKGMHCIYGKAGFTARLMNNEWVIFARDQIHLRYLLEFAN